MLKRLIFIANFLFCGLSLSAQTGWNYQAVLRDTISGTLVNQWIGVKFDVYYDSIWGTPTYSEVHQIRTNGNGLLSAVVGGGQVQFGLFDSIDPGHGRLFMEVSYDFTGGTAYHEVGIVEILPVPIAQYALRSGSSLPGPRGASLLVGSGPPSQAIGFPGDSYLDTAGMILWTTKGLVWPQQGSSLKGDVGQMGPQGPQGLQGPQGIAGANGTPGLDGTRIYTGLIPLNSIGSNGDFFLTTERVLYGPKQNSTWPLIGDTLVGRDGNPGSQGPVGPIGPTGPIGVQGVPGPQGQTGARGPRGAMILIGSGIPTSVGDSGDYFLDTTSRILYGPKLGLWPAIGTSFMGAQGPQGLQGAVGPAGPAGAQGQNGTKIYTGLGTPPAGLGVLGDFYLQMNGKLLYGPKTAAGWASGDTLKGRRGPQGPQGPQGPSGPQGVQGAPGQQGPPGNGALTHHVGEFFGGGIVVHVYRDPQGYEHGLIMSTQDVSSSSAYSNLNSTAIGPVGRSIWFGQGNSTAIQFQIGHVSSAALDCSNYLGGGFADWYLPAIHELNMVYNNLYDINRALEMDGNPSTHPIGINTYWSSTEYSNNLAWNLSFINPHPQAYSLKSLTYAVRAFRSF